MRARQRQGGQAQTIAATRHALCWLCASAVRSLHTCTPYACTTTTRRTSSDNRCHQARPAAGPVHFACWTTRRCLLTMCVCSAQSAQSGYSGLISVHAQASQSQTSTSHRSSGSCSAGVRQLAAALQTRQTCQQGQWEQRSASAGCSKCAASCLMYTQAMPDQAAAQQDWQAACMALIRRQASRAQTYVQTAAVTDLQGSQAGLHSYMDPTRSSCHTLLKSRVRSQLSSPATILSHIIFAAAVHGAKAEECPAWPTSVCGPYAIDAALSCSSPLRCLHPVLCPAAGPPSGM